ncbi:hypothetical protein J0910_17630 [Nocardiopsis sp. CNT-189]|uniref:DUF6603 domain-containing protein n=1 Tax=Nocardiopsis oceanisediminis TaxID=2816862 RepID=UPI003B2C58AC
MSFQVAELRGILAGERGRELEIPDGALALDGAAERLHGLLGPGPLRLESSASDPEALHAEGTAATALGAEPAKVRVDFEQTGGSVTGASLRCSLSAPVPTPALASLLGLADPPGLPEEALAPLTEVVVENRDGTTLTTAEGGRGRMAVVERHREEPGGGARLLVADGPDSDWQVLCADRPWSADELAEAARALRASGGPAPRAPLPARVGEGTWLVLPAAEADAAADGAAPPAPEVLPLRARVRAETDPDRRDGLGRPLPKEAPDRRSRARLRANRARRFAVATGDGFTIVDRTARRPAAAGRTGAGRAGAGASGAPPRARVRAGAAGLRVTGRRRTLTPLGFETPGYSDGVVSIAYSKPPLKISGALTAKPMQSPYKLLFGGAIQVNAELLAGSGAAAFVVPEDGTEPSFFAYGAIGGKKAIGPPPFQVRGVAAGMGWNSRIRIPTDAAEVPGFPLIAALDDPGAVDGEGGDPVAVLKNLTGGGAPWITPAEGELWIAAGLAFSSFEMLKGEAVLAVQAGSDLTLSLLGRGGMAFPKDRERKIANIELAVAAVLKPISGELVLTSQLTPDSYVLDPNCRITGGSALMVWFGNNPNAGDFVLSVGGFHRDYERDMPAHYPRLPRLGLDWGVGSSVSITGEQYFAITPAAAMAGGKLAVRFHAGPVKAWLDAWMDALVKWSPFYFDVGIGVYIGVQASVKLLFVRVTITVEVGADIRVWGPPTGGEAKIKLWFISFTIGFGSSRDSGPSAVDWPGFRSMLPPPENTVRVIAGQGLMEDPHDDGEQALERGPAWQVSAAGFTFSTDSAVPLRELYLDDASAPVFSDESLRIRPMDRSGLTSSHRVTLTRDNDKEELAAWEQAKRTGAVPTSLFGQGDGSTLPGRDGHLDHDRLLGAELTSPPVRHGNTTGDISEEALAFTTLEPDGPQPLDPGADPLVPRPVLRDGAIAAIAGTIASATRTRRDALAGALDELGAGTGERDAELPRYAEEAATAFTAEPMTSPAG